MKRLAEMGATIEARDGQYPPLTIHGGPLKAMDYTLPVARAQGENLRVVCEGRTVREPFRTDCACLASRKFRATVSRRRNSRAVNSLERSGKVGAPWHMRRSNCIESYYRRILPTDWRGQSSKLALQYQVPSGHIGRVRGTVVGVQRPVRNFQGRSHAGDALGRCGIARYGRGISAEATRRFHDHRGPVSGHDPSALGLAPGLFAADQF
jgi:hypothetical protein